SREAATPWRDNPSRVSLGGARTGRERRVPTKTTGSTADANLAPLPTYDSETSRPEGAVEAVGRHALGPRPDRDADVGVIVHNGQPPRRNRHRALGEINPELVL